MCRASSSACSGASSGDGRERPPRCLLHLRPRDPAWARGEVAAHCDRWAPAWEAAPDGIHLDLTGTDRLYGRGADGPARLCREAARVWGPLAAGAAPSRLAAALASRCAAGERGSGSLLYLFCAAVARFLAPYPLTVLGIRHAPAVTLLAGRGVRTLGELQALPPALLAGLLGAEGAWLAAVAAGCDAAPLERAWPAGRSLVAVDLARPLTGGEGTAALLQAVAARALLAAAEGPDRRASWTLRVRRDGVWEQSALAGTRLPDTLAGWRRLLALLWRRLPARRTGVTARVRLPGPRCAARD
ncbi:MAG: hypothetical protein ACYDIE_14785, partial [Candidatus Krumholzibacteriia bacterium]